MKEGFRVVYENTKSIDREDAIQNNFPFFLQASDLETPFINTDNLIYVSKDELDRYPKGRVKKGELLIEVKGKLEKVSVVPNDFPEYTLVSGSLFKPYVNDKINKHTLLTYLTSKYGVNFKERLKTNLLISYISKPDLYKIPVPFFSKKLNGYIEKIFNKIFTLNSKSSQLYSDAEVCLLKKLNLTPLCHLNINTNTKSFKESFLATGRLDAEYYQPKYDSYLELIKNYHNGFKKLTDLCELKNDNHLPNDETQYRYIELSNIGNNGEVTGCTVNFGKELPSRARRIVKEGDVLISSIEGSLSSCALVTKEYDGAICSTGFYVVNSKKINSETLLILFKSELMQNLLKQGYSGTILTAINNDEFKNLLLPVIDDNTQQTIASLIQQSSKLKKQSEQLLEVAKKAVEIAIEQNEATAIDYINSYSELMQEDANWD